MFLLSFTWYWNIQLFQVTNFNALKCTTSNAIDNLIQYNVSLKSKIDYDRYKEMVEEPVPKFTLRKEMVEDFKNNLMEEVSSLL